MKYSVLLTMALSTMLPCQVNAGDRLTLTIGSKQITVELARTATERELGLMGRDALKPDEGMLFVLPHPALFCFWMKNTSIPLSAAFLDAQGKIINLVDMQPHTTNHHCATSTALYAVEVNQARLC